MRNLLVAGAVLVVLVITIQAWWSPALASVNSGDSARGKPSPTSQAYPPPTPCRQGDADRKKCPTSQPYPPPVTPTPCRGDADRKKCPTSQPYPPPVTPTPPATPTP